MDAGWHDDPYGRFAQRYHDGSAWTEHVSHGDGVSFADPSGADPLIGGPLPSSPAAPVLTDARGRPTDLASPWIRLAARILDGIIVWVPLAIFLGVTSDGIVTIDENASTFSYNWGAVLIALVVAAAYETLMVGYRGQTLGKMATGIKVTMKADRGQPSYGTAFIRWVGTALGSLPYVGIFIWIASVVLIFADSQRQMIHDKIAQTVVVKAS